MKQQGHLYIIGVGPSGPQTTTLQAIEEIKKIDSVIAIKQTVQLFKNYIGNKPVLFNPWVNIGTTFGGRSHILYVPVLT